eukprot:3716027-Pyramimonas_sp.AAC.1
MKALILTLDRAKRNRQGMGLYFRRLHGPFKLSSITDASHGSRVTSYAHEAQGLFLCEDRPIRITKDGQLCPEDYSKFLSKAHPLSGTSKKGKRISYSTSHAEAVSAVGGSQNAQYVALRYAELLMKPWITRTSTTTLQGLMNLQDQGLTVMPVGMGTD